MTNILICGNHPLFQKRFRTTTQKLGEVTILPMLNLKGIATRMSQSPFVDMALLDCKALGKNIVSNTRQLCQISPRTTVVVCTAPAEDHLRSELEETGAYIIRKTAREEQTLQIIEDIFTETMMKQAPSEPLNQMI